MNRITGEGRLTASRYADRSISLPATTTLLSPRSSIAEYQISRPQGLATLTGTSFTGVSGEGAIADNVRILRGFRAIRDYSPGNFERCSETA